MSTIRIALIDDKEYGIEQIKNSIPDSINYEFFYFSDYKNFDNNVYDIIFLDYYLDNDWILWKDILKKLKWHIIIWFSSLEYCNEILLKEWADFAVEKLNSNINIPLRDIFHYSFISK